MPEPIPIINEIEEALSSGSEERRNKLLVRVTDLFASGAGHFTEEHVRLFDGVFTHLIAEIHAAARAALAERLAGIPNAPPAAIRSLAFDDAIQVASPVLMRSERLDNSTLVENASTKSQQHLLAISRRRLIAETVTDVLVERGNRDVALSTVRNAGAKFSETGYVRLVTRSTGDDELAQSVGSRPEIPRHHFLKLIKVASNTVRLALEVAHPENVAEIRMVVASAANAIEAKTAAKLRDYAAARTLVESIRPSKPIR